MPYLKQLGLFIFIGFSVCSAKGGDASHQGKTTASELISLTELNSIDKVYAAMLKNKITQKKRESCNNNPDCIAKWTGVEKEILKEESAQVAKSRERMMQILTARYSKEQVEWLVKMYSTPLLKDFRKFAGSKEGSAPIAEMMDFLDKKIKQADAGVAKPNTKK